MAKNKRDCPALGLVISSARCGEERGSVIACPDHCVFNPFARQNYNQFGEIENRVIRKLMLRHVEDAGIAAAQILARRARRPREDIFLSQRDYAIAYHHERDAAGRTLTDRWEADGFAGLNNDERQMLRCMADARLCLLEVHRQLDEYTVEVVDLLEADPQPFLIVDRALGGRWVRFTTLLSWCYHTPHFQRLSGAAREVREVASAPPLQVIGAIVAHLGGPAVLTEARGWMTENIVEVVASLIASVKAVHEAMLQGLDARFGKARYHWAGPAAQAIVEKKLRATPDMEESELSDEDLAQGWKASFDVFERGGADPAQPELRLTPAVPRGPGDPLLGTVLVGPQGMLVQASTGARFAELKHRVQTLADRWVAFESERVDDLAARLLERGQSDYDPALVPPILLAQPPQMAFSTPRVPLAERTAEEVAGDYFLEHYRDLADLPIPALGDRTPRQAAADPALRPDLLDLMKGHLRSLDHKSQQEQKVFDLDWLLRDLGLEEILFPPPPLRGRAGVEDEDEDEDEEDERDSDEDDFDEEVLTDGEPEWVFEDGEWDYDPTLVELPAPGRVLSHEDVAERAGRLIDAMDAQESDFLLEAFQTWPGVGELCTEVAGAMTFEETAILVSHFLQVAWLLHPVPPTGARLHPGRLLHYFDLECEALGAIAIAENRSQGFNAEALIGGTPQPSVVDWIVRVTFSEMDEPGLKRPRDGPAKLSMDAVVTIVCMLKAAVRELCHWPVK